MSNATIQGIWVDGGLVDTDISVNFPIISGTFLAPGVGMLAINDLIDVNSAGATNGQVLSYNTSSGQWEPVAIAGGGDMLAATYDPGGAAVDVYARANHTGTQTAATISDFDTEVSNNTTVISKISDVVDDISPQLGGALDTNGNQIQIGTVEGGNLLNVGSNKLYVSFSSGSGESTIVANANKLNVTGGAGLLLDGGSTGVTFQETGGDTFLLPSTDGSAGDVLKTDGSGNLALADVDTLVSAASTTVAGKVELATTAETDTGTDTGRAVTPDALAGSYAGTASVAATAFNYTVDVATGDGAAYIPIPERCDGMNLVRAMAHVITAGVTGTTDIQVHNVTQTADMLTTKITIDSAETSSETAATPPVIDAANDDVATGDMLRIDVDAISTTAPKGLIVTLEFRLP